MSIQLPPDSSIYGGILNGFFGTWDDEKKLTLWKRFLSLNDLAANPPDAGIGTKASEFLSYVSSSYNIPLTEQFSPEEMVRRQLMFSVFDLIILMLSTAQNTTATQAVEYNFLAKFQTEYAKMISRTPIYTGLIEKNAVKISSATGQVSDILFDYNDITGREICDYMTTKETVQFAIRSSATNITQKVTGTLPDGTKKEYTISYEMAILFERTSTGGKIKILVKGGLPLAGITDPSIPNETYFCPLSADVTDPTDGNSWVAAFNSIVKADPTDEAHPIRISWTAPLQDPSVPTFGIGAPVTTSTADFLIRWTYDLNKEYPVVSITSPPGISFQKFDTRFLQVRGNKNQLNQEFINTTNSKIQSLRDKASAMKSQIQQSSSSTKGLTKVMSSSLKQLKNILNVIYRK
jgi:hypothetical protein